MKSMSLATVVLAFASVQAVPSAQKTITGVASWSIKPTEAEAITTSPRTYREFDPASIKFTFTIVNGSGSTIQIDYPTLRKELRLALDTGAQLVASWEPLVATPTGSGSLNTEGRFDIADRQSISWVLGVRRQDGQSFGAEPRVITVTMKRDLGDLRTSVGRPLPPWFNPMTSLTVHFGPPRNARERADALRMRAERIKAKDPDEALRLLSLANITDPSDIRTLLTLGQTYLSAKRYRESIPVFERALRMQRHTGHSAIPYSLAFAHVALRDEQAAISALRAGGISEDGIKESIEKYRITLGY